MHNSNLSDFRGFLAAVGEMSVFPLNPCEPDRFDPLVEMLTRPGSGRLVLIINQNIMRERESVYKRTNRRIT